MIITPPGSETARHSRSEEEANYRGASYGWQRYVGGLERVLAELD